MTCPNCGRDGVKVTDTFPGDKHRVFRRRKCLSCKFVFRTVETIDDGSDEFKREYLYAQYEKHSRKNGG